MFTKTSSETRKPMSIAFVHHKGGTGKTTSCLNIAGWFTKMNKKALVIDLDPQGNATSGLGIDRKTIDFSIYDVLFGQKNIEETILETESGIYLAPSSLDLLAAETHKPKGNGLASYSQSHMAGQVNSAALLRQSLADMTEHFDYVLIDVPPGSTLLMINGIVASENIIIPIDSGVFAYETLATLKSLVIELNKELRVETNLLMMLLRETSISVLDKYQTWEIKKLLNEFLVENNMPGLKIWTIPFSRKICRAQMKGMPISHYAPYSDAARVYRRIAK
ncbi:MAG: AAA family ATPase, partial [Candidatus Omnitrophota bacterium]